MTILVSTVRLVDPQITAIDHEAYLEYERRREEIESPWDWFPPVQSFEEWQEEQATVEEEELRWEHSLPSGLRTRDVSNTLISGCRMSRKEIRRENRDILHGKMHFDREASVYVSHWKRCDSWKSHRDHQARGMRSKESIRHMEVVQKEYVDFFTNYVEEYMLDDRLDPTYWREQLNEIDY